MQLRSECLIWIYVTAGNIYIYIYGLVVIAVDTSIFLKVDQPPSGNNFYRCKHHAAGNVDRIISLIIAFHEIDSWVQFRASPRDGSPRPYGPRRHGYAL